VVNKEIVFALNRRQDRSDNTMILLSNNDFTQFFQIKSTPKRIILYISYVKKKQFNTNHYIETIQIFKPVVIWQ